MKATESPRIAQPRRNTINRRAQHVIEFGVGFAGTFAAQQFGLHNAHRIDVRIPQPDRTCQNGIVFKQLRLSHYLKHELPRSQELRLKNGEYSLAKLLVGYQARIQSRNVEVGLRESHFDIVQQVIEQGKVVEHPL